MKRFETLLSDLSHEFPGDWWIQRMHESNSLGDVSHQATFDAYSTGIEKLDDKSWKTLKTKTENSFYQNGKKCGLRGKNEFFNLLNESFAYCHLLKEGFSDVRMLPEEGKKKTPDISFRKGTVTAYCEVKTFAKSDKELIRMKQIKSFDNSEYAELSEGFFNKLNDQIGRSKAKFTNDSNCNILYAVLHFDDILVSYLEAYKTQIRKFLASNHPDIQFYGQVGVLGKVFRN